MQKLDTKTGNALLKHDTINNVQNMNKCHMKYNFLHKTLGYNYICIVNLVFSHFHDNITECTNSRRK